MLIQIHMIQNHSPANLNRDDLGAPKTCYFGGVLRSRISSQCLKRSIRMSEQFKELLGGVRTRRLAQRIAAAAKDEDLGKQAERILNRCGFRPKPAKGAGDESADTSDSKMLVYTTQAAISEMVSCLRAGDGKSEVEMAETFARLIAEKTVSPDMALSGRMLEPNTEDKLAKEIWKRHDPSIEAALQVAHAISTHEARPEVDYYVAADDVPGEDAGAGYVDEAMFASACFYKYFAIDWGGLIENLKDYGDDCRKLAAHTVGAFLRGAALTNPTGKQNGFAAHNPPDAILVEISDTPISYANAFANPVAPGRRDIIAQTIAQLGQYVRDIEQGYGGPTKRFWFSPNLRYSLTYGRRAEGRDEEVEIDAHPTGALDELIQELIRGIGEAQALPLEWRDVAAVVLKEEDRARAAS